MTGDDVLELLRGVVDPELGSDIVDLGMVRSASLGPDGRVAIEIALTTIGCPLQAQIKKDVENRVGSAPGVTGVDLTWDEMTPDEKSACMDKARFNATKRAGETTVPATTRVIAIASGKGGVGKSSVTVNLAAGLAAEGFAVGVLDADIGGFSLPRLLGVNEKVEAEKGDGDRVLITPIEKKVGEGLLRVVSMGSIAGAEEDEAVMLRGLMLSRALQHFLEDVKWGDLDYLLIDMPPGTSDIQMALARMLPRTEVLLVTTPAIAAQQVAARAADMARKGYLRVVGVIENMSAFVAPDGTAYPLFGEGGGKRLSVKLGVPLLGQLPLDAAVAAGGDQGVPAVLGDGPASDAYRLMIDSLIAEVLPPIQVGCTAIDALEALVGNP